MKFSTALAAASPQLAVLFRQTVAPSRTHTPASISITLAGLENSTTLLPAPSIDFSLHLYSTMAITGQLAGQSVAILQGPGLSSGGRSTDKRTSLKTSFLKKLPTSANCTVRAAKTQAARTNCALAERYQISSRLTRLTRLAQSLVTAVSPFETFVVVIFRAPVSS